jgi:hypothetical protein
MIIRASLAHVSTTLLADGKDWNNVLFALGRKGTSSKLSPKSIDASEAITRAEALFPEFNRELANSCVIHLQRRNAELHSGDLPFDGLNTSTWLPQFYAAAEALLGTLGMPMANFFGADEATTAATLIKALKDDAAKVVKGTINAHKTIWNEKSEEEQKKLARHADAQSTRANGHRVVCPACQSVALVNGTPAGPESSSFKDGMIVLRQPMLPSHFECKACGLKIAVYSKLNACDLGGTFTATSYADPVDYFEDDFRDRFSGMDEDNNEP